MSQDISNIISMVALDTVARMELSFATTTDPLRCCRPVYGDHARSGSDSGGSRREAVDRVDHAGLIEYLTRTICERDVEICGKPSGVSANHDTGDRRDRS